MPTLRLLIPRPKERAAPCDSDAAAATICAAGTKDPASIPQVLFPPEDTTTSSSSGKGKANPPAADAAAATAQGPETPLKQQARPQLQLYRGLLAPFGKNSAAPANNGNGNGTAAAAHPAASPPPLLPEAFCGVSSGLGPGNGGAMHEASTKMAAAEAGMLTLDSPPPPPLPPPAAAGSCGLEQKVLAAAAAAATGAVAPTSLRLHCRRCAIAVPAAAPLPPPPPPVAPAQEGLVMTCGAAMIPHTYKAATGGEDAFFASSAARGALAVADGVSGWADDGVDPGDYARTLVQHLREAVEGSAAFNGRAALHSAQIATRKHGSATALVAALTRWADQRAAREIPAGCEDLKSPEEGSSESEGQEQGQQLQQSEQQQQQPRRRLRGHGLALAFGRARHGNGGGTQGAAVAAAAVSTQNAAAVSSPYVLEIANLGDGGLKVVRQGRVVFETNPQQHAFNMPFQLSHPALCPSTDFAQQADLYSVEVETGDVIIAASDGLWDNMWDPQLLRVLSDALKPPVSDSRGGGKTTGRRGHRRRASASHVAIGGEGNPQQTDLSSSPAAAAAAVAAADNGVEGAEAGGVDGKVPALSGGSSGLHRSSSAPQLAAADGSSSSSCWVGAPGEAATRAAGALAAAAHRNAEDMSFWGPWSAAAARHAGFLGRLLGSMRGGKMDDITVVVGLVTEAVTKRPQQPQQQQQQQQQQQGA